MDDVFLGCANQAGEDNRDVARMAALLAGLPATVPGVTLNRLCASGMDAVGTAARAIKLGEIDLAIAGGVESMSRAPFVMGKSESPFQRGAELHDTTLGWRFVNPQMKQSYGIDSMVQTAEHVAQEEGVSREDQDAFAWRSQDRAARAQAFFAEEIVPVTGILDRDEHPRPETTMEALRLLQPVDGKGTVTAGNASGINDGAAAMLLASGRRRPQARSAAQSPHPGHGNRRSSPACDGHGAGARDPKTPGAARAAHRGFRFPRDQ